MPIKPERKRLYPYNWEKISLYIKERAGWKCELCRADHGKPHPITRSEIVLTVHHINGDPSDNRRINLIALCQRCHNRLDLPFRQKRKISPLASFKEEPGALVVWAHGCSKPDTEDRGYPPGSVPW